MLALKTIWSLLQLLSFSCSTKGNILMKDLHCAQIKLYLSTQKFTLHITFLLLLPSACSRVSTCPVVSPAVSSQEPGGSRSLFPPVRTHSDAALVSACPRQARLCFPGQRGPPPRLPPSVIASFLDSLLRLPVKVDVLCPLFTDTLLVTSCAPTSAHSFHLDVSHFTP